MPDVIVGMMDASTTRSPLTPLIRNALSTTLRNVSEATGGAESVIITTQSLRDGSLLYLIQVAPQEELNDYSTTFRRLKQTMQVNDARLTARQ